ncbi:MAG: hypothetical protein ACJAVX_001845 [Pseudoalteromonas rhizosphaerae]|jgi:hypothetical protein|uniref:Type IV pilus biogenesis protein PilP n=1 Tax=Pseudoalteromonas neustonica TaxID=1840331 RepID=A0ABY3FBE9_9GAMM|nr:MULTISPECIES: hypothetical protein [Pseudoalteromonas]MBB1292419.1 hypothetical protein [Pseudoalteromonas sp. SR41-4]MBB1299991.1 hypothetical protein [Pseudoalteromonas sp. SR44-8]MBB1409429.1 hypothetical protein [Pseudoalteromonas sp. SG44-17]TVU81996.1 hypothetical protein FQP85_14880 [Pseudoalteromonas neustonica]|tara:strand:+ start:16695 stop:17213 length:519 start_codon:yes stop_codon:yes gene_type:complete
MKKQLLPILALLSIPTVHANEVNLQALQACTFIENDFNRLLCYDNTMAGKSLTKPETTKTLTPPASSVTATADVAVASKQIVKVKNEDFGLEHKELVKENDNEITAVVTNVKEAPYGELIISLNNGQQWRQIGSDSLRIDQDDTVIIERGMFNSFLLKKAGQNRSIRVKRTN